VSILGLADNCVAAAAAATAAALTASCFCFDRRFEDNRLLRGARRIDDLNDP